MNEHILISDVIDAFKQEDFDFVGMAENGWPIVKGDLRLPHINKSFPCEIEIDPTFVDIPKVRLLEIPSGLPPAVPHLGSDGALCYIDKGTIVLDIFDPIGQSLACLDRASAILEQIINNEILEDLTEEFFAYWGSQYCFVDIQNQNLGKLNCIIAEAENGTPLCFLTDNSERTYMKAAMLGYKPTEQTVLTYRIQTKASPKPFIRKWPPNTVSDILTWQSSLDPSCRRKIHQRVKEGLKNKDASGMLILIESPLMTYGFIVYFDRPLSSQKEVKKARVDITLQFSVVPVSVVKIDDHYLAQRNIPELRTLAGKNLIVVGCGTIGGYLSEMLVKAGAGTGGGLLTLVDFEILLPQNIGRHRLGFPHILMNKAKSLGIELKYSAPGAEILALPVDVRTAHLGNIDLLIDATGEEALGHWLSSKYPLPLHILTVWIEGPGTAVRSLLRSHNSKACFRCLSQINKKGDLCSTVEAIPQILSGHGCEGLYVPFSATASVQAASLGVEAVLDWANGVHSPSLRTKLIDCQYELATFDCDPLKDEDCPICNS
ncbi:ThiF family adenylyltransferase [Marinomonas atlantica]|uniref:ThiF family adenylyltransferase n=1 Tax=Marinomonas atlantica TaxID=1806668 RepID=UPI000833E178|nr:E2/UBC family protein [Marinomonas atlantica]